MMMKAVEDAGSFDSRANVLSFEYKTTNLKYYPGIPKVVKQYADCTAASKSIR